MENTPDTSLCFSVQTSKQTVMESDRSPVFARASHEYAILLQHVRLLTGPVSSYNCGVIDKGVNTFTRHSGAHFTTTFEISRCDKGVGTLRRILSDWKRMATPPKYIEWVLLRMG